MIFISYRRKDTPYAVPLLYNELCSRYDDEPVFCDIDNLKPGDNWPKELLEKATAAKVMLVVIGLGWQNATYTDDAREGELRLDDRKDWVRLEIQTANPVRA